MTTSKDDIIKLAKEHGATTNVKSMTSDADDAIVIFPEELEAFFHAAQKLERECTRDMSLVCNKCGKWAEYCRCVSTLSGTLTDRSNHETK